jgi:hypothetical protein
VATQIRVSTRGLLQAISGKILPRYQFTYPQIVPNRRARWVQVVFFFSFYIPLFFPFLPVFFNIFLFVVGDGTRR